MSPEIISIIGAMFSGVAVIISAWFVYLSKTKSAEIAAESTRSLTGQDLISRLQSLEEQNDKYRSEDIRRAREHTKLLLDYEKAKIHMEECDANVECLQKEVEKLKRRDKERDEMIAALEIKIEQVIDERDKFRALARAGE